jgi:NAD(P)-dependent dehydrogenase (short-subunit alcohol dehydrogenase family)
VFVMTAKPEQLDMTGQTVLVTGGTGGIGYQTARALAADGAQVVITGRDAARGEDAAAAIRRESGGDSVTFIPAEHSTVGGNRQLARRVRAAFPGLGVLINNVGGLYETRWETADGYEATLAMNFVGPVALTAELLPLLQANAPARCINVVSAAIRMYKGDPFGDIQSERGFIGADTYAQAKLLNVLFTLALARRAAPEQVTVNMVHPGVTWTAMTRSQTWRTMPSWRWIWPVMRLLQRHGSPIKAARRVSFLASSPQAGACTGEYFERKQTPKRLSPRERDPGLQERAWQLGSDLVAAVPINSRLGDGDAGSVLQGSPGTAEAQGERSLPCFPVMPDDPTTGWAQLPEKLPRGVPRWRRACRRRQSDNCPWPRGRMPLLEAPWGGEPGMRSAGRRPRRHQVQGRP